jgi:hypothetical protein
MLDVSLRAFQAVLGVIVLVAISIVVGATVRLWAVGRSLGRAQSPKVERELRISTRVCR